MSTRQPLLVDRVAARRFAQRAALRYAHRLDPVAREIESRMAERLALVRLEPHRILDAASGRGTSADALRRRFPEAQLIALDYAAAALPRPAEDGSLWRRARRLLRTDATRSVAVCADLVALPIATASCQMVWANLALGAEHDPMPVFREWHRVLAVGGLLMLSTYGPDTLRELRAAFALVDDAPHVHGFIDMHDLGDMLVAAGFAEPVMDMETLTLTYASVRQLMDDLRETGQLNALADRRRTLSGRARRQALIDHCERSRQNDRFAASVEIVYGLAWKPAPRAVAEGASVIHFERSTRKRGQ